MIGICVYIRVKENRKGKNESEEGNGEFGLVGEQDGTRGRMKG